MSQLQMAALSAHVFKWYQAGLWQDIELHNTDGEKNVDGAKKSVVWNGVNVGGWWGYNFVMEGDGDDHGVFQILFHCKGEADKAKDHIFKQVAGTGVYEMQKSTKNNAYDEVLLVPVGK